MRNCYSKSQRVDKARSPASLSRVSKAQKDWRSWCRRLWWVFPHPISSFLQKRNAIVSVYWIWFHIALKGRRFTAGVLFFHIWKTAILSMGLNYWRKEAFANLKSEQKIWRRNSNELHDRIRQFLFSIRQKHVYTNVVFRRQQCVRNKSKTRPQLEHFYGIVRCIERTTGRIHKANVRKIQPTLETSWKMGGRQSSHSLDQKWRQKRHDAWRISDGKQMEKPIMRIACIWHRHRLWNVPKPSGN